MSKQDRQGVRTAVDLERKYRFGETFAEFLGIAEDAKKSAEEAKDAVGNLDKELTPEEIFNRLTDNGKIQGVYRDENGQIYMNASYILSGILLADLIQAGVLKSKDGTTFYLDLENGILKMQATEFSVSGKTVDAIAKDKADTAEKNAKTYADSASKSAVEAQTQMDIFNKLTNNGALPGLFMDGGQLYINASYLATGIIKSKDGAIEIDLSGGDVPVFNTGISTNGLTVRADEAGSSGYVLLEPVKMYSDDGSTYYLPNLLMNRLDGGMMFRVSEVSGLAYSAISSEDHNRQTVMQAGDGYRTGVRVATENGEAWFGEDNGVFLLNCGTVKSDRINPGKKSLYKGSCAVGESCTVPNTEDYDLFAIYVGDGTNMRGTAILCYKMTGHIRGIGGRAGDSSTYRELFFFEATISGDTWTVQDAKYQNVYDSSMGASTTANLMRVVGII